MPAPNDAWTSDISRARVAAPGAGSAHSGAPPAYMAGLAKGAYTGARDAYQSRKTLFTVCIVAALVLATAAVVVSAIAFSELPPEQNNVVTGSGTVTPVIPTLTTTQLTAQVTTGSTSPPQTATFAAAAFGNNVAAPRPAHRAASRGSFVALHGSPFVSLQFLCNDNFGNGTCRAVFSYEIAASAPEDAAILARAGSDANTVLPVGVAAAAAGDAWGDVGQPQTFVPSFSRIGQFGGASFFWPCAKDDNDAHSGAHEIVWTLRTGPAGSFSAAKAHARPAKCPAVPL